MTQEYYECHITCIGNPDKLQSVIESLGWKFSKIDGDPTLGNGVKCYATKHYNKRLSKAEVAWALEATAETIRIAGASLGCKFRVLREKIELVIHDVRHKEKTNG